METLDRTLLTFFVNALWQAALVAAAVALTRWWMRNAPARHAHAVCVAGLVAALLLPIAATRRPTSDAASIAVPQRIDITAATPSGSAPAAPAQVSPTLRVSRGAFSIAVWAFGIFLLIRLSLLAVAAWKTARICRTARPAGPCPAFDRARDVFGVDRAELRWSSRIAGPVTAGRLVILPDAMRTAEGDVLATAIGHEMAHIARGDFAWNLAYELLSLPISFHPAALWLRRQIDRTRELACDELVTARMLDSRAYAQSIMDIAARMTSPARPSYTLGVLDGDILEERIKRLLRRPAEYTRRARLLLGAALAGLAVSAVVASTFAISARAQGPAQQEIRAGADAYNAGRFAEAVQRFEKAVAAEPDNITARLALAHTYLRTDRPALAANARAQYLEVIRRDPHNTTAILGLAAVNGPDRAAETHKLVLDLIQADPKNKDAYYTAGVVDWQLAYPPIRDANGGNGPQTYNIIADTALRQKLQRELLPTIEEGYRLLQIALDLDPQYSDAMAYMNLLQRLHSALSDTPADHDRHIAQADDWVRKALDARKAMAKVVKVTPSSDRIGPDGELPRLIVAPPPPPPPPPPPGGFRGNGDK